MVTGLEVFDYLAPEELVIEMLGMLIPNGDEKLKADGLVVEGTVVPKPVVVVEVLEEVEVVVFAFPEELEEDEVVTVVVALVVPLLPLVVVLLVLVELFFVA